MDEDESYGYKYVWLNWGIFDSAGDDNIIDINGSDKPFLVQNSISFSDYYDREYIFIAFFLSLMGSLVSFLGWPIQLLMTLSLENNLIINALTTTYILLTSDKAKQKNINTLNYLFEVTFRWTAVM